MNQNTRIKVIGVGGSGTNTVSRMAKCLIQGVDLIAINTDIQSLRFCKVKKKLLRFLFHLRQSQRSHML